MQYSIFGNDIALIMHYRALFTMSGWVYTLSIYTILQNKVSQDPGCINSWNHFSNGGCKICWKRPTKNLFRKLNTYLVVRFLVLVTTMVTKVDHSNHRSNDRSNHRGYYDGYYNGYT